MALPSDRIQQPNLVQMFMLAQQLKSQQLNDRVHESQLARVLKADERSEAFRTALTAGDMDAARAADPMAFMGLQSKQLEARRAGLDVQKDESKLIDDRLTRNQNVQRAIYAGIEADKTPEGIRRAREARDALVATGKVDKFTLPGEDTANDDGVETWVQAEPTKSEIVTAQAGAGVDVAGKQRAINEQTTSLRDKFDALPETKAWKIVKQGVDNILSAAGDGPGDLARIYSLVKILDTNSAVKDAEIGLAAGSGGYIQAMKSIIERAKGTGVLTPEMRTQLEDTAQRLAAAYKGNFDAQAQNYAGLAKSYGLDAGQVVMPLAPMATKPMQGLSQEQVPEGNTSGGTRRIPYTVPPPIAPAEADALADKYGFK